MKRLLWALRFSPLLMFSGVGLVAGGGYCLAFLEPVGTSEGMPFVSVVGQLGDLPWIFALIAGALCILWALWLDKDAL